jgi:protein involved in polysaccharide export with SLBB domain
VPLGGSDRRALPDRSFLPPMFGANLFSPEVSVSRVTPLGGIPGAQNPGANPGGQGPGGIPGSSSSTSPGASSTGAGATGAPGSAAVAAAAAAAAAGGAAGGSAGYPGFPFEGDAGGASGAGGPGGTGRSPIIPPSTVQSPVAISEFDPNHVMAPGDVAQIHIYGATNLEQPAVVNSNGDIFLPTIGPVHVGGILAGNLQAVISSAIASVYHSNAQVYVNMVSALPIPVFVTGGVTSPGQYTLPSLASVISFLQAAGGIDSRRGSYRSIQVLRNKQVIATIDLYEFLLRGDLPDVRLRARDTIFVGPQGPTVAAIGDVSGVYRYELTQSTGAQLIQLARPYPDATRVNVAGIRSGRPVAFTYTLPEFQRISIEDGDVIAFRPDVPTNVMTVKFEGRLNGPSTLVVTRQATLYDLLPYLPVDTYFSDPSSIYVRRVSVAQAQYKGIQDQLQRLKAAVVTAPTITGEQAQMRQQEAEIIFKFADQLANVQPEGRLVVARGGKVENVRLEDGDVIVVPSRSDLVLVSGEVRLPQAIVWVPGADSDHYIDAAGGFTDRGDDSKILVVRASGETVVGTQVPVFPSDRVIVLPSTSSWTFPLIKDLSQILYQVAVTTGLAFTLK